MKANKFKGIVTAINAFTTKNAPAILAGVAVVGVIATSVAAFKAGVKASDILKNHKNELKKIKKEDKKERKEVYINTAKKIAPIVVPPVVIGVASIGCIFGSHSVSKRRIAALSAAYSISESALKDLNGKMTEVLGEKKTREIKDAITNDKLKADKIPSENKVIITGTGDVLCRDSYTGRYFRSNAEKIGQAINWASNEARVCMCVSLNEFYDQLNVPRVPMGDDLGWNADDLVNGTLPITYTACLTEDNQPCICVESYAGIRQGFRELY